MHSFDFSRHVCLVLGHEEHGVPIEILNNSDKIYIPMPGVGFCLNTSQAGNIILYETIKRYEEIYRNNLLFATERLPA